MKLSIAGSPAHHSEKPVLTYSGIHKWIVRVAGQPSLCEECGDNSDRKYQWADLSSNPKGIFKKDRANWKRMCIPCHKRYDLKGVLMARRKPIVQKDKDGTVLRVYTGATEASKETGILISSIANNLKGSSKTAGGYKWELL